MISSVPNQAQAPSATSGAMSGVKEQDVGITEFLCVRDAFNAVFKQQLDDFLVNEIAMDGTVVVQKSTDIPKTSRNVDRRTEEKEGCDKNERKEQEEKKKVNGEKDVKDVNPKLSQDKMEIESKKADATTINNNPLANADYDALDAMFPDAEAKHSGKLRETLEKNEMYTFPPQTDKPERTKLHTWVRENLSGWMSETVRPDGPTGPQCIRVRKGRNKKRGRGTDGDGGPGGGKRQRTDPWYVSRNDFVQCTLWKRGRDTMEAISEICKALNLHEDSVSMAGTKDRRGVTVQQMRVRGLQLYRFAKLFRHKGCFYHRRKVLSVGDFTILRGNEAKPFRLGDLSGNRFTLVLRGVGSVDSELINKAVEDVRNHGFINYFGLQRFGSGVRPTHKTGFALLRGDYRDAVLGILTPLEIRSVEGDAVKVAGNRRAIEDSLRAFVAGELTAKDLRKKLPQWMRIESALADSFAEDESEGRPHRYKNAFKKVQRSMQSLYVHATQSYLWNRMASARIATYPHDAPGRRFAVAGDIVPEKINCKHLSHSTKTRVVSKEEADEKSIPIHRVLIPVIGSLVKPPAPETNHGRVVQEIADEEKINLNTAFTEYGSGYKGSYRRLVCVPGDFSHRIEEYESTRPIVFSRYGQRGGDKSRNYDAAKANTENGNGEKTDTAPLTEKKDTAKANTEGESGGKTETAPLPEKKYAAKNNAENENGDKTENVPLTEKKDTVTDEKGMKVENGPSDNEESEGKSKEAVVGKATSVPVPDSNENLSRDGNKTTNVAAGSAIEGNTSNTKKNKALVISFSLSISGYATMLVRELTHSQTDTRFQKQLVRQSADGTKDATIKSEREKGETENPKVGVSNEDTAAAVNVESVTAEPMSIDVTEAEAKDAKTSNVTEESK